MAICAAFADVLGLDRVGTLDGFFELGGNSLLAVRLLRRLHDAGLRDIAPATLFAAPTAGALGARTRGAVQAARTLSRARRATPRRERDEPIAIIGMAGRFPGAADIETFWKNLCDGHESIRVFRRTSSTRRCLPPCATIRPTSPLAACSTRSSCSTRRSSASRRSKRS